MQWVASSIAESQIDRCVLFDLYVNCVRCACVRTRDPTPRITCVLVGAFTLKCENTLFGKYGSNSADLFAALSGRCSSFSQSTQEDNFRTACCPPADTTCRAGTAVPAVCDKTCRVSQSRSSVHQLRRRSSASDQSMSQCHCGSPRRPPVAYGTRKQLSPSLSRLLSQAQFEGYYAECHPYFKAQGTLAYYSTVLNICQPKY